MEGLICHLVLMCEIISDLDLVNSLINNLALMDELINHLVLVYDLIKTIYLTPKLVTEPVTYTIFTSMSINEYKLFVLSHLRALNQNKFICSMVLII